MRSIFLLMGGLLLAALLGITTRTAAPKALVSSAQPPLEIRPSQEPTIQHANVPLSAPTDSDSFTQEARSWAESEPELAAAWARQISDTELRERVSSAVATTWADQDPIRAAEFLMAAIPAGQAQENAALGIMQRLAFKNLDEAEEWISRFPDGARERATDELTRLKQRQMLVVKE